MSSLIAILFGTMLFAFQTNNIEELPPPTKEPIVGEIVEIVDTFDVHQIAIDNWQQDYMIQMIQMREIEDPEERMKLFKEFKVFLEERSNVVDPPENIYDCFSDEECQLMFQMVETECHGNNFDSKLHCANVMFNRWKSDDWGKDITTIITSPNQFAYGRTQIDESTKLAVEAAWLLPDLLEGATFFHSGEYTETFNGAKYVTSDDAHHFYAKEEN